MNELEAKYLYSGRMDRLETGSDKPAGKASDWKLKTLHVASCNRLAKQPLNLTSGTKHQLVFAPPALAMQQVIVR